MEERKKVVFEQKQRAVHRIYISCFICAVLPKKRKILGIYVFRSARQQKLTLSD